LKLDAKTAELTGNVSSVKLLGQQLEATHKELERTRGRENELLKKVN